MLLFDNYSMIITVSQYLSPHLTLPGDNIYEIDSRYRFSSKARGDYYF